MKAPPMNPVRELVLSGASSPPMLAILTPPLTPAYMPAALACAANATIATAERITRKRFIQRILLV
jgi:hypothetical protein